MIDRHYEYELTEPDNDHPVCVDDFFTQGYDQRQKEIQEALQLRLDGLQQQIFNLQTDLKASEQWMCAHDKDVRDMRRSDEARVTWVVHLYLIVNACMLLTIGFKWF
jgi:hypothetical protein